MLWSQEMFRTILYRVGDVDDKNFFFLFPVRSMKQNLVVLLADFFNLFEIHPTKCVCYPGMDQSAGK